MSGARGTAGGHFLFVVTGALGAASLLLFGWFLCFGPVGTVEFGLATNGALVIDGALCLIFFVQHSGMVRSAFRRRLERLVPGPYSGAVYSLASSLALFALVLLWQGSVPTLWQATGVARAVARLLLLGAAAGFLWAGWALHSFDTFGLSAIRDHLRANPPATPQFVIRGPYRWVRHPLYLCSLIVIWTYPLWTADRILFNVLFSLWVVFGTMLEERDLVRTFGDDYRRYQSRVPMLLPLGRRT